MIETILQLISIFDIEIELLKKRKIKEMIPWQSLESALIQDLEKQKNKINIPENIRKVFNKKIEEKKYFIERNLVLSKKFFEMLIGEAHLYNYSGHVVNNNTAVIMDKRV